MLLDLTQTPCCLLKLICNSIHYHSTLSGSCFLTFIIILLRTSALLKSKSKVSSGSCVWILQSVNTPPSSNLWMNNTCKIFILVGITRKANLCLPCHKSSLFVSSLILQGKHVKHVYLGRREGEKCEMSGRSHFPSLSSLSPSHHCLSQDTVIVSRDCSLTTYKMIVVLLFLYHKVHETVCHFVFLHWSNTVPDPDLEIRGEGLISPPIFLALWASVWSKNKGRGAAPPEPSPGSTTATQPCPIKGFLVAILSTSNYFVLLMSFSKYHNCLTNLVIVTCSLLWKISWEFVPIRHGEIFLMNDDKFYLNEWMDTFI